MSKKLGREKENWVKKNALFWRDVEEGRETGAFAVLVIKLGFENELIWEAFSVI